MTVTCLEDEPIRLVLPRPDEMEAKEGKVPGRLYDIKLPCADGITDSVFKNARPNRVTVNLSSAVFLPSEEVLGKTSTYEDNDGKKHTLKPVSLGPLFLWDKLDKKLAQSDERLKTNLPAPRFSMAKKFAARLAGGITRDWWWTPGWSSLWYRVEHQEDEEDIKQADRYAEEDKEMAKAYQEALDAAKDDFESRQRIAKEYEDLQYETRNKREKERRPNIVGNYGQQAGDWITKLNLLRVSPSTLVCGQRQIVYIVGAELADPGEVISPSNIKFKLNGASVTASAGASAGASVMASAGASVMASAGALPEQAKNKIIIHRAIGTHWGFGHEDMQGYCVWATAGRLQQCLKLDITIGPEVPVGVYDIELTTPNGLKNFTLDKVVNMVKLEVIGGYYVDQLTRIVPVQVKDADGKLYWLGYGSRIDNNHPAAAVIKVTLDAQTMANFVAGKLSLFDINTGEKCVSMKEQIKTDTNFLQLVNALYVIWEMTPEWLQNWLGWEEPTTDNVYPTLLALLRISSADIDQSWQTPIYTAPMTKEFVLGKTKDDKEGPRIKVRLEVTNIVADTNRDGVVTDDDIIDAKSAPVDYLHATGALVLANTNFDGKLDGGKKRDCDDEQVNGDNDLKDVAMLKIHKLGLDANEIPEDMTVKLELLNPDNDTTGLTAAQKAHIFDGHQNNSTIMLGGTKPVAVIYKKNAGVGERNIADLAGAGNLELGIEGVEYGTEVIVRLTASLGAQKLLEDNQRILVSPFLVASNTGKLKRAFVGTSTDPNDADVKMFANEFISKLGNIPLTQIDAFQYSNPNSNPDGWIQDCMEIGYSRMAVTGNLGYREMNVTMDLNRPSELGKLPKELVTSKYNLNLGYIKTITATLDKDGMRHNGGGNIEASPPIPNSKWPAGRIIVGGERQQDGAVLPVIDKDLKAFFERQKVQVDKDSGVLSIDTSWLSVGHVDEIISFCEIGGKNRILIAAPQEAMALWIQAGNQWAIDANTTVHDYLLDPPNVTEATLAKHIPTQVLRQTVKVYNDDIWNNYLRTISQQLPREVGMSNTDVILVPVVFLPNPYNGRAMAFVTGNPVNLFVCGPGSFIVGNDPSKTNDPSRLVVRQQLGNNAIFIDSRGLFERGGDVHCGSNAIRGGLDNKEWSNQ